MMKFQDKHPGAAWLLYFALAMLLLFALAKSCDDANAQTVADTVECRQIVVKKGDWLSKFAQKFYGDAKQYGPIVDANDSMRPDRIFVGDTVYVPTKPVFGTVYTYSGNVVGRGSNNGGTDGKANMNAVKKAWVTGMRAITPIVYAGPLGGFLRFELSMSDSTPISIHPDSIFYAVQFDSVGWVLKGGVFIPASAGETLVHAYYRMWDAWVLVKSVGKPQKAVTFIQPKPQKNFVSDVGLTLGAGYSIGDFSHLPILSVGAHWQRKVFIEGSFGKSFQTDRQVFPDGEGTLRKQYKNGSVSVFPTRTFPLGLTIGYSRDENRIESFGQYAVKKEGPFTGLRLRYKPAVVEILWTPGESDFWYERRTSWDSKSLRINLKLTKIFGGN